MSDSTFSDLTKLGALIHFLPESSVFNGYYFDGKSGLTEIDDLFNHCNVDNFIIQRRGLTNTYRVVVVLLIPAKTTITVTDIGILTAIQLIRLNCDQDNWPQTKHGLYIMDDPIVIEWMKKQHGMQDKIFEEPQPIKRKRVA